MIRAITKDELHACLDIYHEGYETVAIEFGLTEENSPDRGRASLPYHKLLTMFESGTLMYAYYINDIPIGILAMRFFESGVCGLDDIIVLPEHRHKGFGLELLNYCKQKAKELGASKVRLGMIDDNKTLRLWYENNGFINVELINYDGAPYTVGKMECPL